MSTRRLCVGFLVVGMMLILGSSQVESASELLLTIGKGQRGDIAFDFKVISTSNGLIKGDFYAENPGLWTIDSTVECMDFSGDFAVIGGSDFTAMVSDSPYPDGIIFGAAPDCDSTGFGVPIPITEGNIIVVNPNSP
jgi:hypothetical protein